MTFSVKRYRYKTPQWGLLVWRIDGYVAFDFFFGKRLFVLGFRKRDE